MSGCPHNDEYACFACETAQHDAAHPVEVEGCRTCKYRTIRISNTATPNKQLKVGTQKDPTNNWERGIATDHRGVPYLKGDGSMIGVKEFQNNRSTYEQAIRDNRQQPAPV